MKIVFITKNPSSPSFQFYKQSFKYIENFNSVERIDFITKKYEDSIFLKYDFAIFMGGSVNNKKAKEINPSIKIVVVDSRAGFNDDLKNIDLLICNSLEMQIYHQYLNTEFLVYPTYPLVKSIDKINNEKKVIIGYHGNKVHLETMYPRITQAIQNLSLNYDLEFIAMYNIDLLKKSKIITENNLGCKVTHVNFSYENYKMISQADIGLVPQLIPFKENIFSRSLLKKYNESSNDYILRFKDTNNIGRHLVFAQYKIPVITDMTPSSCQLVTHGHNGYFAYGQKSWQRMIEILILNKEKRTQMGNNLFIKWKEKYSYESLNEELIKRLISVYKNKI